MKWSRKSIRFHSMDRVAQPPGRFAGQMSHRINRAPLLGASLSAGNISRTCVRASMTPMNSSMSKSAELSRSRSLKSFQKRPVLTRLPMLLTKRTISCGSTRCDNPSAHTAQKKSGAQPQPDMSGVGQEEEKGGIGKRTPLPSSSMAANARLYVSRSRSRLRLSRTLRISSAYLHRSMSMPTVRPRSTFSRALTKQQGDQAVCKSMQKDEGKRQSKTLSRVGKGLGGQYLRASSAVRRAAGVCRRATVRCRAAGVVGQCDGSDRPGRLLKDTQSAFESRWEWLRATKCQKGQAGAVGWE